MGIDIVRYRPEDRPALKVFLKEAFPDRPRSDPDLWEWVFRDRPPGSPDIPEVWLLRDGDRVVGQLPTRRIALQYGRRLWPARATFDFHILAEYRNRGAGPLLVRALSKEPGLLVNLGPNRAAFPIFRRFGWSTLSVLPRAVALLDPGAALERFGVPAPLRRIAGLAAAALRRVLEHPPRGRPVGRVETAAGFDGEFDAFWDEWSSQFAVCFHRNVGRMNWRYRDYPLHLYQMLAHRTAGRLTGVLAMRLTRRKRVPTGIIVEQLGRPDAAEALLREAVRRLAEQGAAVIHARLPHRDWEGVFRRAGFAIRRGPSHVVQLMTKINGEGPEPLVLRRPENWFVSFGDGDGDW